jgi:hypothetical protein
MDQTLFNIAVTVSGFLGGWWLKVLWDAVKDLQSADKVLVEKVNSIEILVAGNYMTKSDFDKIGAAIFAKLDKIEDKLDRKVDK